MAMAASQIITIATALHIYMVAIVVAQGDVVISVEETRDNDYLHHIHVDEPLFTQFHECLSEGAATCEVVYVRPGCPNCTAHAVRASGQTNSQNWNNYYECIHFNVDENPYLKCQRQTDISVARDDPSTETYRLPNSVNYSSVCFGFVWNSDEEGLNFTNSQLQVETCGSDCTCPGRDTTPQPGTKSTPSSQSLRSTTEPTAPSTSRPSSVSTAGLITPSTKPPTQSASTVSSGSFSSPSTEFSSDSNNSGDDAPIGVIIGAAVGVIVIIVIIIIIIVLWKRRRAKAKASGHVDNQTSAMKSNGAEVNGKTNDGKSHLHHNTELSGNNSESHNPNNSVIRTNGYQNSLHQPSMTKHGVIPVKHPPKPQFIIKQNDSDFGYSTAQLEVTENKNRNVNGKKLRDDYDYVSSEDDGEVSDQNPKTTRRKTPVVNPPKVKEDYAVVDKTSKNQDPGNDVGLKSDYNIIPEEDYGYSHALGDPTAQDTNSATAGKSLASVLEGSSIETSDLHRNFDNEYSRASDGYTTEADGNQPNTSNDDPNTKTVYSRLHEPVRDIQNPYNVDPNTNDVYSKLHEEVRDIKNPYNLLPEAQETLDSNSALPDTAHNAHDTKVAKPSKSLPYGKEDYAVVVKTKSTNKPTQASFQLRNDEN